MKTAVPVILFAFALSTLSLCAAEADDPAPPEPSVTTVPTDVGAPVQSAAVITGKFEAMAPTKEAPAVVGTFASKSGTKYLVLASPELLKKLNATASKNVTVRGSIEPKKNTLKIVQVVETSAVPGYRKRAGF